MSNKRKQKKKSYSQTIARENNSFTELFVLFFMLMCLYFVIQGKNQYKHHENKANITYQQKLDPVRVRCLAKNIFFEARGESYDEKVRVANVTINRRNSDLFPDNVCGVVYQPKQFSWTIKYKDTHIKKFITNSIDAAAWKDSVDIAELALSNKLDDLTHKALFYHANYVNPKWNYKKLEKTVKSQAHVYYKLK